MRRSSKPTSSRGQPATSAGSTAPPATRRSFGTSGSRARRDEPRSDYCRRLGVTFSGLSSSVGAVHRRRGQQAASGRADRVRRAGGDRTCAVRVAVAGVPGLPLRHGAGGGHPGEGLPAALGRLLAAVRRQRRLSDGQHPAVEDRAIRAGRKPAAGSGAGSGRCLAHPLARPVASVPAATARSLHLRAHGGGFRRGSTGTDCPGGHRVRQRGQQLLSSAPVRSGGPRNPRRVPGAVHPEQPVRHRRRYRRRRRRALDRAGRAGLTASHPAARRGAGTRFEPISARTRGAARRPPTSVATGRPGTPCPTSGAPSSSSPT